MPNSTSCTSNKTQTNLHILEKKMVEKKEEELQSALESFVIKDKEQMWSNVLLRSLRDIAQDLKSAPELRGQLLSNCCSGNIRAIAKSYKGIPIRPQHFLARLPGVIIGNKGQLIVLSDNVASDQLKMRFMLLI